MSGPATNIIVKNITNSIQVTLQNTLPVQNTVTNAGITKTIFDTTVTTIVLNANNLSEIMFAGSASIGAPKTWSIINTSTTLLIPSLKFTMTTLDTQTFPSNFKMSDARWVSSSHTWTPFDTGTYEFSLSFDGTNWTMTCIGGPFT
jgi:hypothetical protein